jgi:hypothetical protein
MSLSRKFAAFVVDLKCDSAPYWDPSRFPNLEHQAQVRFAADPLVEVDEFELSVPGRETVKP